jgi:hypothetical protein
MAKTPKNQNILNRKIDFFKSDLKDDKLQKAFTAIFERNDGNWTAIQQELAGDKNFSAKVVQRLEFTHRLAEWSEQDETLVRLFQNDAGVNALRDIALTYNEEKFVFKVKDNLPGASDGAKVVQAEKLYRSLFQQEPTAMLVNMVKDPNVPVLNDNVGLHVSAILEAYPSFNIRATSVYELLKEEGTFKKIPVESQSAITTQLKTLQRIVAISPVPKAVPALYNAKLHTALQIAEMPPAQFKKAMSEQGLDNQTLDQIHANAQYARVRNEQALMALKEAGQKTGIAMIDRSLRTPGTDSALQKRKAKASDLKDMQITMVQEPAEAAQMAMLKNNLSWDLLFGDADFCECGECTSVYSATSYYVELLQYLRNNNLGKNVKADAKDISGTPLEKLLDRRPDLGCLELTCENTNTILPYIDLVNEVMENYVAFKHLKPFNVKDETSSELLSEPQHTEYQAYCILKNAVYPFTLPYHQPIDAARIYLKYLETSRHQLIDIFRKDTTQADASHTALRNDALDRAADAEFLHITKEEYVILTKECFESKPLMDIIKNKVHTATEYAELIGVKPVCKYYGYETNTAMLGDQGLTNIKTEFLPRTGIDYTSLVDLLLTAYVNPCLPKGKSKTIMESLRFSYRFLQNYAKMHGLEKMAQDLVTMEKLADIVPKLKEYMDSLRGKKELACPDTAEDKVEITDKDIVHWVKCNFEKTGRMIVIESGRGCVNGEIIFAKESVVSVRILVRECQLYYVNNDNLEIPMGSIDKRTGKLTFNGPQENVDPTTLNGLLFQGDNGEKGIFMLIGNEVYLIFLEQKDSCDLSTALLQHLDGTPLTTEEYDRIHRFIRLWRKMGWTMAEIDSAIVGLSLSENENEGPGASPGDSLCSDCGDDECKDDCETCDECEDCSEVCRVYGEINPRLIHQLVAVRKLMDITGLELIKLLAFWTDISMAGKKSLYARLFLTHNIVGMDKVFKADNNGNYLTTDTKISEHMPVTMAALNLTADDMLAIMTHSGMEDKLTLKNLSLLYRYRLLSKSLGLKIQPFISIMSLFNAVFASAYDTLNFLETWQKMEDAGFTHQQLNFIINNIDDSKKPFTPAKRDVLQLAKTLYDGLNAIDTAHPDLKPAADLADAELQTRNVQEQASAAFIRTKASLLFDADIVEKVISLLEGTIAYTTNAPKNIAYVLPDTKSLSRKLVYDPVKGSIQITGVLTATESLDFKALSNDPNWSAALARVEKQQNKMFKELLSGIFENEQTWTPGEKSAIEASIKTGDIVVALDQIAEGDPDPNTAPVKRVGFLKIFLPYLRQQLSHRLVVNTLSAYAGLATKETDVLISEVLVSGSPSASLFSIFEKIKESAKPADTSWRGYLIPASENTYTFIVRESDAQPVITLDGVSLDFTVQEDPTNEWWSASLELEAGKLYNVQTTGIPMENIFWKTPSSSIAPVPASALIPDFASAQCAPALTQLVKISMLVSTFELNADEIRFFAMHGTEFGHVDFNSITFAHWSRLEAYVRLRNSLPQASLGILDFWKWIYDSTSDETKLAEQIALLTEWDKDRVTKLIAAAHFNMHTKSDFRDEQNLLKLQKALAVADKIGMDIDLLFEWAVPASKFKKCREIADGIRNSIRAKYNQTDWEQVVKPLHDELRNHQKEALTAYLLQQQELITWGVTDANGLFEFFLIDVQMDACMETSRIKQAISSVQLFVQRCFLGLEEEHNGITPDVLDRDRWEWMQRYRVWEANRKVFLYPENWIESNLRDDKSPFFKELESELLQKDINKQNVTDALKSYLYKVDEVANMEVVGVYIEGTRGSGGWSEGARLHVFSRTRNAPYFFFYRYLALDEMNWYPWMKMQIDIPSYDIENASGSVIGNGCYLTPVAWNGRLLVFFPQIMKKTKPNPDTPTTGSFEDYGKSPSSISDSKPIDYFEMKMAWSEYRNGKWTQKQVSANSLVADIISGRRFDQFTFIPKISGTQIFIHVEDQGSNDTMTFKGFTFTGSIFQNDGDGDAASIVNTIPSSIASEFGGATKFQRVSGKIQSMQLANGSWGNDNATFTVTNNTVKVEYVNASIPAQDFYHPYAHEFLKKINQRELSDFFGQNLTMSTASFGPFDHDGDTSTPNIYHELKRPYSLYNWELFMHTPTMLADSLSKSQQFEEAMKWYHFVFNPIADGTDDKRFWQFQPFKEVDSQRILDSIFGNLKPNKADQTISEWRENPFMPHVVARSRPVAYMKWVVMKYLDNLIAWGDYLFRQDTIETINQATQLYILAWHILGQRPMMIPRRGKIRPQTYLGLLDKWDAFGNAMVELELAAPFSNQTEFPIGAVNGKMAFANIFGLASSLYFCIPNNPKLMGYWDTLDDRLYKIRHCENIEGVFRKLPLFEPPIDPALLVKAAAQGLSIASVLNDLNTPMPNYRFYYLLQKALELCGELKSLGSATLSAIEKKDNEMLAVIRARHEGVMQNLIMEIKKKQVEEAQKSLDGLVQNRKTPEHRMKYFLKLIGEDVNKVPGFAGDFTELANAIESPVSEGGLKLIKFEKEDMDKASEAQDWQRGIGIVETLASVLHIIPAVEPKASPFGVGVGAVVFAGSMLGNAAQAVGRGLQVHASDLSFASSSSGKKGNFLRSLQDRIYQANTAGYEIKQIDKQIISQQIRMEIANLEITNQQKAIDHATEVEDFLKSKYTNEEVYTWMRGSLKTLYYQVYSLAYELAKKAEKVFRFERGLSNSNFIQSGYWDAGRDGLLAGEQLFLGLKQLEMAYQSERGHDYEITKQVSLRQINPLALIQLREKGTCEFSLPEVLFDMDYPGHYKRRIKTVSLSIPCVAGPYTGVNASLRLLENKFRNTAISVKAYEENLEETDDRFSTYLVPISAIAASSAQNDSGMFELNFKDERYLPFEGAGLISTWRLELPEIRQFDYHTIADIIVHIRYTACEGGDRIKKSAVDSVTKFMKANEELAKDQGLFSIIDLRHDMPTEWYRATTLANSDGDFIMDLTDVGKFIPYYLSAGTSSLKVTDVLIATDIQDNSFTLNEETFSESVKIGNLKVFSLTEQSLSIADWKLSLPENSRDSRQTFMVLRMTR